MGAESNCAPRIATDVCGLRLKTMAWAFRRRRCRTYMSRELGLAMYASGCACCTTRISAWKSRAVQGRVRLSALISPNSSPPCRRWVDSTRRSEGPKKLKTRLGRTARHLSRGGTHPRFDRRSAEAVDNSSDSGAPLRERVRNCMKLLGLQGCDSKRRSYMEIKRAKYPIRDP